MAGPMLCREGRDNRLDEFRLIFAMTVLCAHSYFVAEGHHGNDPLARISLNQITTGSLAVDAFFAISGYLVCESWNRSRGVVDFLRRRVLRIYPGFVVACLFCAAIAAPFGAPSFARYRAEFRLGDFIKSVATLRQPVLPQTFLSNPAHHIVNGSMWTIWFEFGCYLGVAALGFTGLLRGRVAAGLLAVAVLANLGCDVSAWSYLQVTGFQLPSDAPNLRPWSDWARFLSFFLAGSVAYLYRDSIPRSRRLAIGCGLLMMIATQIPPAFVALLPIAGVYLLFLAAFPPGAVESHKGRPDLSYGVYLYSFPIQQLIVSRMPGVGPWTLTLLAIPPTLIVAGLSWYAVERPALALKARTRRSEDRGPSARWSRIFSFRSHP
jgi:peptidoglycan/LPS O-acetylase OafA/YrhL